MQLKVTRLAGRVVIFFKEAEGGGVEQILASHHVGRGCPCRLQMHLSSISETYQHQLEQKIQPYPTTCSNLS